MEADETEVVRTMTSISLTTSTLSSSCSMVTATATTTTSSSSNKRNRTQDSWNGRDGEGEFIRWCHGAKKPRESPDNPKPFSDPTSNRRRRLADSGDWTYDSDSDYDDLDDMVTASDIEDFADFEDGDDDESVLEDDNRSTVSTQTNMSTGSVGSNTPSLVGENLESFSLGEASNAEASTSSTKPNNIIGGGPLFRSSKHPLRSSLFPFVSPYINFFHHNEISEISLPSELRKQLRWKLSNVTPAVVKRVVTNSGFRLMRKTCTEWGGTWGNHMRSVLFKEIGSMSKINHFPGTFNIGRKDRLWKNYHQLKLKFGKEEFSFLPRTFCLPQESKLLRRVWEKRGGREKWIVKPPALARGSGIKVVHKWSEVPKTRPLIVQKYIGKPHLINNTKYDLRIYVLLTSISPLIIYLFDDGLVRFASNQYDPDPKTLSDVYMHLTNYSINKNSASYLHNEDSEARHGHKWTLASLWAYFDENGIDHREVWDRIKDMAIKTIVSAEDPICRAYRPNLSSHYSAYELFGFDVLLDAKLKPWLIEVNISPSLHSASPLDLEIKSSLAVEVFNIVGYQVPAKISQKDQLAILRKLNLESLSWLCLDKRLYVRDLSKADRAKQDSFLRSEVCKDRESHLEAILETLTPDDLRFLIRYEDEKTQTKKFERIFPTTETHKYFKFFSSPRYYNLLLDAWETKYHGDSHRDGIERLRKLCSERLHLKVPAISKLNTNNFKKKNSQIVNVSMLKAPTGDSLMPLTTSTTTTIITTTPSVTTVTSSSLSSSPSSLSPPAVTPTQSSEKVKVSKVGVTSKALGVKPLGIGRRTSTFSSSSGGGGKSSSSSASSNTSTLDRSISPEPMSIGGDSDEKSRTPSPLDNDLVEKSDIIGNDNEQNTNNDTITIINDFDS